MPIPRILVLEDDHAICNLIEPALRGYYRVTIVNDLKTALDVLNGNGFEAALIDLSVGDSLGMETLDDVRKVAHGIPLVVMTGSSGGYEMLAMEKGAQAYITKPFTIDVLIDKLHRAVVRGEPYRLLYAQMEVKDALYRALESRLAVSEGENERLRKLATTSRPRLSKTTAGILIAVIAALGAIIVEVVRSLVK